MEVKPNEVSFYENFGYHFVREESRIKRTYHRGHHRGHLITVSVIEREPNYPNANTLDSLLSSYKSQEMKRKPQLEVDAEMAVILFLLLIIPGIIYLCGISAINKSRNQFNAEISKNQREILARARKIVESNMEAK